MIRPAHISWLSLLLLAAALLCAGLAWQSTTHARVEVEWRTASEANTAGFNLFRSEQLAGPFTQINSSLVPVQGDAQTGGDYHYSDDSAVPGQAYFYWLEELDFKGQSSRHGPISVQAQTGGWMEGAAALALLLLAGIAWWDRRRQSPRLVPGSPPPTRQDAL